MKARKSQRQLNALREDKPREELSNASLQAAADELRLLANDVNHYKYSDPWLIDWAARLSLGPFGELYCDLHKAKTPRQKEMKSIVYQIMGLLRDITRRQYSKTCAHDLGHWADRLDKCLAEKQRDGRAAPLETQQPPKASGGLAGTQSKLPPRSASLILLKEHPDWTDTKIAKEAGVCRQSLYRWTEYKQLRRMLCDKWNLPRGSKDKDTGKIEAVAED